MIHNQVVNQDLESKGIRFIMDTKGNQFIDWSELTPDDVVIIPAFGTTLEIERKLQALNIQTEKYNTTCPFVEKVWNRAEKLGNQMFTIIIHGKPDHEETRATFSHSRPNGASIIIRDIEEAKKLGRIILGEIPAVGFYELFKSRYSDDFNVEKDLQKVGVVNQTTMLASDTKEISGYFRQVMITKYGAENYKDHFSDTRDTLCYATNDNQDSTFELLKQDADFAIVVGGYNSSNTSHLVELLETKFPTYFINTSDDLISEKEISHFNIHANNKEVTKNYIPVKEQTRIIITSGASCPDILLDQVLLKLTTYFPRHQPLEKILKNF